MKEAEIDILMQQNRMVKLIKSKFPTWVTEQKDEGIELVTGKFNAFKIVQDGERVYGQPAGPHVQKILDALQEKPEQKTEQVPATAAPGNEEKGIALIPDQMTRALLEKWKNMKTEDRMFMFQKTAKEYIEERDGPGGKKLKYVKGNVIVQELNIAFLFDWDSIIEEVHETETGFWVRGHIKVRFEDKYVQRSAIGTADKHKGVNSEDVAKAAAMDMIKKAASFLGFNGDVYRGEV